MTSDITSENNEAQAELKRCISRLSYVGVGLSPELDKALANLRTAIKADENETKIKEIVDDVSKILRTLEDKSEPSKVEVASNEVDLLSLLLEQKLPTKLKVELKKVSPQKQADIKALTSSIVVAINQFLDDLDIDKKTNDSSNLNKKPGFFSRLFKKQSSPSLQQNNLDSSIQVPENLKESLRHLVERLLSMDADAKITLSLTEKVIELNSVSELADILELITDAFLDLSEIEHAQFETFLKSLNKRIDRISQFIVKTANYSQQVKDDSHQLDSMLQGEVSSMKLSVENATSLTEVKSSLTDKMDSIVEQVSSFCTDQTKNHLVLNKNLTKLQEQLTATEDESSRLRDELAEQKSRALTDPLTRLPNRYSYNERLAQEYNRWRRYRSPLSLVIGDIDLFKKVNDNYGHAAGDDILITIANYFQVELRESDFIARYGGEEFVILLPETSLVDATKAINKLRMGIKHIKTDVESNTIQTTMSFGISEFGNDDTPKAVFTRADKALYRAKEKGRDQVCCQIR